MIILIIGLLIFVGTIIYVVVDGKGWCGFVDTIIFPAVFALIISFVSMFLCLLVSCAIPKTAIGEVGRSELQLIALKDNMAVDGYHGGRYVYRGYIDEELQYTYLYEAKGKGVTSGRCDADRTYINYTKDAEQPKLVTVEYNITNPVWKFFSANDMAGVSHRYEYYLYVPEGSIVAEGEYEIDLE